MKLLITIILSNILVLLPFYSFSQFKYEKEVRISSKKVPDTALEFVKSLKVVNNVKWYKEISDNKISYEAKTHVNKKKCSIEFSEQGNFEDIEILSNKNEIEDSVYTLIIKQLNKIHEKFKIEKIQIQYRGSKEAILNLFNQINSTFQVNTFYEFVVSSKINNSYQQLEYLFSKEGKLIEHFLIRLRNTDNLEY